MYRGNWLSSAGFLYITLPTIILHNPPIYRIITYCAVWTKFFLRVLDFEITNAQSHKENGERGVIFFVTTHSSKFCFLFFLRTLCTGKRFMTLTPLPCKRMRQLQTEKIIIAQNWEKKRKKKKFLSWLYHYSVA